MDTTNLFLGLICFGPIVVIFLVVWLVMGSASAALWRPVAQRWGLRVARVTPWSRQALVGTLHGVPVRAFSERRSPVAHTTMGTFALVKSYLVAQLDLPTSTSLHICARSEIDLFGAAAIQGVGEKVTDAPRELASIASIWRGTGGRYPLLENAPAVHKLAIVLERYPHSTVMDDRIYLRVQAPPRSTEALGELMRATDSLAAAIATGASGDEEPQCGLR